MDYGLRIDLDDITGRVKRVEVSDIKPGEEEIARAELQKLHDDVMAKQPPVPTVTVTPDPPTPTIREALDLYFAEDTNIKGRSKQRYEQLLRPFVSHFGADRPLGFVNQQEFNKYADHVKATPVGKLRRTHVGKLLRGPGRLIRVIRSEFVRKRPAETFTPSAGIGISTRYAGVDCIR